ncbi:hypothetical protein DMUE_0501 [Dictyocoela muelleri]|nr:hypothetical protein DMUE_0501 [Dictyocoela muelleri]
MFLKKFRTLNQQFHPIAKFTYPSLTITTKTCSSINTYNTNLQLLFSYNITGEFEIINQYIVVINNNFNDNSNDNNLNNINFNDNNLKNNNLNNNDFYDNNYNNHLCLLKRGILYKKIYFSKPIINICGDDKNLIVATENKIFFFKIINESDYKGYIKNESIKNECINNECIKTKTINKNKCCINISKDRNNIESNIENKEINNENNGYINNEDKNFTNNEDDNLIDNEKSNDFMIVNLINDNQIIILNHTLNFKNSILYNQFKFKNKILIANENKMILYNFKKKSIVYRFKYVFKQIFYFDKESIIGVLINNYKDSDNINNYKAGDDINDYKHDDNISDYRGGDNSEMTINNKTINTMIIGPFIAILNLKTENIQIINHKDIFPTNNQSLTNITNISSLKPYLIIVTSNQLLYFSNLNLISILDDIIYASFIPNTEYILCISKNKILIKDLQLNVIKKREVHMPPYNSFSIINDNTLMSNTFNKRLLISNNDKVQSLSINKDEQNFIFNIKGVIKMKDNLIATLNTDDKYSKDNITTKCNITTNNSIDSTSLYSIDYNKLSHLITTPFKNFYSSHNFYMLISHKAFILTKSFKVFRSFEGDFQSGAFDIYLDKIFLQNNNSIEVYKISDKKKIKIIKINNLKMDNKNNVIFSDNENHNNYFNNNKSNTSFKPFDIEIKSSLLMIKDNNYFNLLIIDINSYSLLRIYSDCREYNFSDDLKYLIVVGEKMKIYDTRDDFIVYENDEVKNKEVRNIEVKNKEVENIEVKNKEVENNNNKIDDNKINNNFNSDTTNDNFNNSNFCNNNFINDTTINNFNINPTNNNFNKNSTQKNIKFAMFTSDQENILICKENEISLYSIHEAKNNAEINHNTEINLNTEININNDNNIKFNDEIEDMCYEILSNFDKQY